MPTRPDKYPEWASDETNNTEPNQSKKEEGWENGENPVASSYFNWYQNLAYDWVQFLDEQRAGLMAGHIAAMPDNDHSGSVPEDLNSVAFGKSDTNNYLWAACGASDGSHARILYSKNPTNGWTDWPSNNFGNAPANGIACVNPVFDGFVVVGNGGRIATLGSRYDPLTYTNRTSGTSEHLKAVACNGTRILAVGDNGQFVHSTNGTSWTAVSVTSTNWKAVAWVPWANRWLVVGDDGVDGIAISLTSDLSSSTQSTIDADLGYHKIAVGPSRVVVGSNAAGAQAKYSDASSMNSWTAITTTGFTGTDLRLDSMTYAKGLFLGAWTTGEVRELWYSADGATWKATIVPSGHATRDLNALVWDENSREIPQMLAGVGDAGLTVFVPLPSL